MDGCGLRLHPHCTMDGCACICTARWTAAPASSLHDGRLRLHLHCTMDDCVCICTARWTTAPASSLHDGRLRLTSIVEAS